MISNELLKKHESSTSIGQIVNDMDLANALYRDPISALADPATLGQSVYIGALYLSRHSLPIAELTKLNSKVSTKTLEYDTYRFILDCWIQLGGKGELEHLLHDALSRRERLREHHDHSLYGLICQYAGLLSFSTGRILEGEDLLIEACGAFERGNARVQKIYALSDLSVAKKRLGRFEDAALICERIEQVSRSIGFNYGVVTALANLTINRYRSGQLIMAAQSCQQLCEAQQSFGLAEQSAQWQNIVILPTRVSLLRRKARAALDELNILTSNKYLSARNALVIQEFILEAAVIAGKWETAKKVLEVLESSNTEHLPDIHVEFLRRRAEYYCERGRQKECRLHSREAIAACKRYGDMAELASSLRVRAEMWLKLNDELKAALCARKAREISEDVDAVEYVRSTLAEAQAVRRKSPRDAEELLLSIRSPLEKLAVPYYTAESHIVLADVYASLGEISRAHDELDKARPLLKQLQGLDERRLTNQIKATEKLIDQCSFEIGQQGAQTSGKLFQAYESAAVASRLSRAALSHDLAEALEAEQLFVARPDSGGHRVTFAYNIPVADAKEILRRLDRPGIRHALNPKAPTVHKNFEDRVVVITPLPGDTTYYLCSTHDSDYRPTPLFFERVVTSMDVVGKLTTSSPKPTTRDPWSGFLDGSVKHPKGPFTPIKTVDTKLIRVLALAERAAKRPVNVLINGETGVGKDLLARAIHKASGRGGKFVAINAGGMPVALVESQLFGHVRGAYTDAVGDREGLIEDARGGTLFLDEIGEMPESVQVKLLRLLESGEYRRLGDNATRIADVRIVAATNRDLAREVRKGNFREDLFYRLSAVNFVIPALRERPDDIPLLARHFFSEAAGDDATPEIAENIQQALKVYSWPGNIRELKNEISRVVSLIAPGQRVVVEMLSPILQAEIKRKSRPRSSFEERVAQFEKEMILEALDKNDWNRLRTADEIGIPRTTLLAKMKRYNIANL